MTVIAVYLTRIGLLSMQKLARRSGLSLIHNNQVLQISFLQLQLSSMACSMADRSLQTASLMCSTYLVQRLRKEGCGAYHTLLSPPLAKSKMILYYRY